MVLFCFAWFTTNRLLIHFQEADKGQVVEVNLGCRDHDSAHRYRIFVTTFLGYGANEAIARYHRHILLSQIKSGKTSIQGTSKIDPIPDPCLPNGLNENYTIHLDLDHIKLKDAKLDSEYLVHVSGKSYFKNYMDLELNSLSI